METAKTIRSALKNHSPRLVLLVETYSEMDFDQIVMEYARENPQILMEIPQVSVGIYGRGAGRLVELNFLYQNSRDNLNKMQKNVQQVFNASELYRLKPSPSTWWASWTMTKALGSMEVTSSFRSVICCFFTAARTTLVAVPE